MLSIIYCTALHTEQARGLAYRIRVTGNKAMIREGLKYSEIEKCDRVIVFPDCDELIAANYAEAGIQAEVVGGFVDAEPEGLIFDAEPDQVIAEEEILAAEVEADKPNEEKATRGKKK